MSKQSDFSGFPRGGSLATQAPQNSGMSRQSPDLRRLVHRLRWLVPLALALLVVVYDLTLAPWLIEQYGYRRHLLIELILFGTVGPIIAFVVLELLGRWLDERDTADYQAQLLVQARQERAVAREISDDTFQTLYATSMLLGTLSSEADRLPDGANEQLAAAQRALHQGMSRLRAYLGE